MASLHTKRRFRNWEWGETNYLGEIALSFFFCMYVCITRYPVCWRLRYPVDLYQERERESSRARERRENGNWEMERGKNEVESESEGWGEGRWGYVG